MTRLEIDWPDEAAERVRAAEGRLRVAGEALRDETPHVVDPDGSDGFWGAVDGAAIGVAREHELAQRLSSDDVGVLGVLR